MGKLTERYIEHLQIKANQGEESAIEQLQRAGIEIDSEIVDKSKEISSENRRLDILASSESGYKSSPLNFSHSIALGSRGKKYATK